MPGLHAWRGNSRAYGGERSAHRAARGPLRHPRPATNSRSTARHAGHVSVARGGRTSAQGLAAAPLRRGRAGHRLDRTRSRVPVRGDRVTIRPSTASPRLFWWCLPVTLLLTWVVRRAAPVVAAHLPAGGPLALRDYGVLGSVRHRWYVVLWSALLGAGSHLLWDGFTHSPATNGWAVARLPGLTGEAVAGIPWFRRAPARVVARRAQPWRSRCSSTSDGSGCCGSGTARRRSCPGRPVLFWSVAVAVLAAYPLTWPRLTHLYQPHVQGVRLLLPGRPRPARGRGGHPAASGGAAAPRARRGAG